ncbi:MAG TPA: molybdate ABC transporter substrate-binding protein [Ilumatobacteraceae bacterium]|nr:molybdate ABC transporter substrate-binding protein [Ilumatobacteraceae bacterium]
MRSGLSALVATALLVGATGCADDTDGTLVVFAAASLTDAFADIGEAFEAANPGVEVQFNFASSSDLARQVVEGAPADVYASADLRNMDRVVEADRFVDPVVFATNRAEIIVAPGNPLALGGLADLAAPELVVVLCAPEVPCGAYAEQVFDRAGVAVTPDSYEENVRAVVTKVTLGEADAGVVYATDIAGVDADGVEIPADVNVIAAYPIAAVSDADGAASFVEFVTGPGGQDVLAAYGFGPP